MRNPVAFALAAALSTSAGCGDGGSSTATTPAKRSGAAQTLRDLSKAMNAAAPDIQAAADEATKPSTVVHIAVPMRAGTRTFRGNGSLSLGTLRVRRPSHFYWTSDAPYFSLSERDARFYIDSGASAGKSAVEPGHYRAVKVSSIGNWTLRVVPDR